MTEKEVAVPNQPAASIGGQENQPEDWDLVIKPQTSLFDINFRDIWRYRDLWYMYVKRDVITVYKQTVLGPIWFFVQPILTMMVYIVVFGNIAGLSTDGIPKPLFYLSGIIFWNYFSSCFSGTSSIFRANAGIFGKVFFPRLIVPLAVVTSNLIKFIIQGILFIVVYIYFIAFTEVDLQLQWQLLILLPLLIILMAILGLSFGMIFSSLTTKYRDLTFLMGFGVQLLMYATPIIYPMSILEGKYAGAIWYNPIAHIIEAVKYMLLGTGQFSWTGLAYAATFALVTLSLGIIIFNKTEKDFIDTV